MTNANDIIGAGNNRPPVPSASPQSQDDDPRNKEVKEPQGLHPVVQERLDREANESVETVSTDAPESSGSESKYVTQAQFKSLEDRIKSVVQGIKEEFSEVSKAMKPLIERDRGYKGAFNNLDEKISAALSRINSLKNGGDNGE